jgi:hypothetical protein
MDKEANVEAADRVFNVEELESVTNEDETVVVVTFIPDDDKGAKVI